MLTSMGIPAGKYSDIVLSASWISCWLRWGVMMSCRRWHRLHCSPRRSISLTPARFEGELSRSKHFPQLSAIMTWNSSGHAARMVFSLDFHGLWVSWRWCPLSSYTVLLQNGGKADSTLGTLFLALPYLTDFRIQNNLIETQLHATTVSPHVLALSTSPKLPVTRLNKKFPSTTSFRR